MQRAGEHSSKSIFLIVVLAPSVAVVLCAGEGKGRQLLLRECRGPHGRAGRVAVPPGKAAGVSRDASGVLRGAFVAVSVQTTRGVLVFHL